MMSILVKGMAMPTSCNDCPMCYNMMECVIASPYIGFSRKELKAEPFDFCNERHPRCPLTAVPPHGRLIDADELAAKCDEPHWCVWLSEIDEAPTIIAAEEGGVTR